MPDARRRRCRSTRCMTPTPLTPYDVETSGLTKRFGDRTVVGDVALQLPLIPGEPMNGLDPAGIQEFRGFVRDFVGEGRTIVLSSHLLDEVEKTCDHVAIVDQGRIVVQGSIDELRGADGLHLLLEV